ncbi:MAG: Uma2 family endonuclease [Planctomycetota bacterium]
MPTPTLTTADGLLSLREPGCRHELVRGALRRMSPAGHWHGDIGAILGERLTRHVRRRRLGKTYNADTGFLLAQNPDTVLAPDFAFVRTERLPPARSPGYFPGPPDLAVEIRSPRDSRKDAHEKALSWLAHGARGVWVIDPGASSVTVYRSHGEVHERTDHDDLSGDDLVPGFSMPVRELFAPDR